MLRNVIVNGSSDQGNLKSVLNTVVTQKFPSTEKYRPTQVEHNTALVISENNVLCFLGSIGYYLQVN